MPNNYEELIFSEMNRIRGQWEDFSKRSTEASHKLGYFVLGFETVVCGYLALNHKIFSEFPLSSWIFLLFFLGIIFGLSWLKLYSWQLYSSALYMAERSKYAFFLFEYIRQPQVNWDPIGAYDAKYPQQRQDAENVINKANGGWRMKLQLYFFWGFTITTYLGLIASGIVIFFVLKNGVPRLSQEPINLNISDLTRLFESLTALFEKIFDCK